METNPIMTAAVELFASYNAQGFRCRGGEVALDAPEWKKYEDFREAAELFNEKAGKEVMHVGLLKQLNGEDTWEAFALNYDEPDAVRNPEMYSTSADTHVVGFDSLNDEEACLLAVMDDMEESDAQQFRALVTREFVKIREQMDEKHVLVHGADFDYWEVCDRHPIAWTEDTIHYRIALIFENDLYE